MPFKNDPVVGRWIQSLINDVSFILRVFSNDLMSLLVVPAGWQWLIDDTIKSLHLIYSGVKDNILVSASYRKPLLFWYWRLDFMAGFLAARSLGPLMQGNFLHAAGCSRVSFICLVWRVLPGWTRPGRQTNAGWMELYTLVWQVLLCIWNKVHVSHTDVLVSHYINELKSHQMATCCGSALALGCLPRFLISGKLKQVCLEDLFMHSFCMF